MATKRTCDKGHTFYKSSDCPTCPICEAERNPSSAFLAAIGAPARRALERKGLTTLNKLAKCSEADLLALHGVGPSAIPKLKSALNDASLDFKSK